jgi:hypothetical protein
MDSNTNNPQRHSNEFEYTKLLGTTATAHSPFSIVELF